jgi:hypothetical protein
MTSFRLMVAPLALLALGRCCLTPSGERDGGACDNPALTDPANCGSCAHVCKDSGCQNGTCR